MALAAVPPPPAPPPSRPPGMICTSCMNARGGVDACRAAGQECILDPPSFDDWTDSGRGGTQPDVSWRRFLEANATYTRGFDNFRADGGEHCAFGHADHAHANLTTVDLCRPLMEGDDCGGGTPVPAFLCVCVSGDVAFAAQDTLGKRSRFNFVLIGLACCGTAMAMLLGRALTCTRDYLRRRRARRTGLRRVLQRDEHLSTALPTVDSKADREEMVELWRCAACCTCLVAFFGGPALVLLALPRSPGYWVGCGFRIPEVNILDVVARPEFGANRAAG